jgi:tetratricopeptide (TPR) repeat protein
VFGWSSLRAWRTGKYLFVEAPKKELYDQSSDPNAEHNLALDSKAVADTLASQLDSFRQNTSSASDVQRAEADPELEEKLSALGYVSSRGGSAKGDALQTGPDPKDKVEISNKLYQGLLAVEDAQYQDAIPVLEEVIAKQPNVASAYVALGTSWARLKEYDKAIPPLRRALELRDAPAMTHYELAMALSQTGDWEGSVPEFEAAAKKLPKRAELHFSLAAAYARVNRMSDARKELETTLQLEPDNLRANLVLGRMLSLEGDPGAGLPRLKKAVALNPKLPDAHLFLADAYKRLGQKANAARERAEAERLRASGGQ